jgi:hypothetical protein
MAGCFVPWFPKCPFTLFFSAVDWEVPWQGWEACLHWVSLVPGVCLACGKTPCGPVCLWSAFSYLTLAALWGDRFCCPHLSIFSLCGRGRRGTVWTLTVPSGDGTRSQTWVPQLTPKGGLLFRLVKGGRYVPRFVEDKPHLYKDSLQTSSGKSFVLYWATRLISALYLFGQLDCHLEVVWQLVWRPGDTS